MTTHRLFLICSLLVATGCGDDDGETPDNNGDPIVFVEQEEPPPPPPVDMTFEPDHVMQVEIRMEPADFDALRNQARSFFSEFEGADCRAEPFESPYTYFHAAISMDGEALPDIGIRKKGFIGSQSTEKPGFRINLDEYVDGAELFGIDNVTLNNSVQDPALIRQCLSYGVYTAAGYPAPRCNFARVSMNGDDLGIYVHIEPIKRRFLRKHFGNDDGDMYEGTISDFLPGWFGTFEPKTDETDLELTAVKEITAALDAGEPVGSVLETYFDVDMLMTHLALESIVGHWDGYAGNRNNFRIYRRTDDDKFVFIPWGTDGTFRSGRADEPVYNKGALMHHLLADAELRAMFATRVQELLDSVFAEDELLAEIGRMETVLAGEIDLSPHQEEIENVRAFVERRRAGLSATLPGQPGELEAPFCLLEKGSMAATFETTWGSLGTDLTQNGTLDLTMIWEGEETQHVRAGVGAGISDQGDPILVTASLLDPADQSLFISYIGFDPETIVPGEPLPIGAFNFRDVGPIAEGGLLFTNSDIGQLVPVGFMNGGELLFDAFGTANGDLVTGSMNTTFYGWEEVPP